MPGKDRPRDLSRKSSRTKSLSRNARAGEALADFRVIIRLFGGSIHQSIEDIRRHIKKLIHPTALKFDLESFRMLLVSNPGYGENSGDSMHAEPHFCTSCHYQIQYAVVARMVPSLKRALKGLRYEPMSPHWEIAEFEHRPHGWAQARRCIVARKKIEDSDLEPTLFSLERYAYRAWHTNLPLTPAGVWHFYDGRAGMERRIREVREDYAARKIPTRAFAANALYLEVVRLAYNLVTAFQRTCLPEDWQSLTLSKLRQRLLWLPGELTRPQNRPILRLVNSPLIAQKAEKILRRVHKLKPLEG